MIFRNYISQALIPKLAIFLFFFLSYCSNLISQYQSLINKFEDSSLAIEKRVTILLKQSLRENIPRRIWIGYSIFTKNQGHAFINKWDNEAVRTMNQSLQQMLYQKNSGLSGQDVEDHDTQIINRSPIDGENKKDGSKLLEAYDNEHPVAIIMDFSLESGRPRLYQMLLKSMDQPFNLEGRELFWLGEISQQESVEWLCKLFYKSNYLKMQRQIISILWRHYASQQTIRFLNNVISGKFDSKLKEDCIFLLGQYSTEWSNYILCKIIIDSKDPNLRRKAILSICQSNNIMALKVLSLIAKMDRDKKIRKEALFSLGQLENEQSLSILYNILTKERDADIKEFAIFVISQVPNEKAIDLLRTISQKHPDLLIRRKALYWLQNNDSHKAHELSSILN